MFSDRVSASMMNAQVPYYYDMEAGGMILDPALATILCSWAFDGGTMGMQGDPEQTPGCYGKKCEPGNAGYCYWEPGQEKQMMQQQRNRPQGQGCGQPTCGYNEIVLSGATWQSSLPGLIQAFYFPVGGMSAEEKVRKHHQNFLTAFGLESSLVPLLRLDLANRQIPFQLVDS